MLDSKELKKAVTRNNLYKFWDKEQPYHENIRRTIKSRRQRWSGPRSFSARLHLGLSRKLERLLSEPGAARSLEDPGIRDRVAAVYADIACMRWMCNRSLEQMRNGQPTGPDGSLAKLAWGRTEQRLADLAVDMVGMDAAIDGPWAYNLVAARQTTIAGGTTEINRNIIAEMGLGLPREPKPA